MKKRHRIIALLAILAATAFWLFRPASKDDTPAPVGTGIPKVAAPAAPMITPPPPTVPPVMPAAPVATAPPVPAAPLPSNIPRPPPPLENQGRNEAEAIARNLRHFGQRFGGNPTGTNAEITQTLNGGNPQGVRYLPQEHLRLNAQGELLDHYGSPYFFHQNSATQMEVRSAGPDKILWTQDDIIEQ